MLEAFRGEFCLVAPVTPYLFRDKDFFYAKNRGEVIKLWWICQLINRIEKDID
jgi:hypothetical protein